MNFKEGPQAVPRYISASPQLQNIERKTFSSRLQLADYNQLGGYTSLCSPIAMRKQMILALKEANVSSHLRDKHIPSTVLYGKTYLQIQGKV
jgi:hypothetical protein